jgi:hypothetical protein
MMQLGPECLFGVCAVTRRRLPVGASPTRQQLQPEAIGAGLFDPVSATQPALTAEHQHREGLSFCQAVKTMFK